MKGLKMICNFLTSRIFLVSIYKIGKIISETCVWSEHFLLIFLKYFFQNDDEKIFPSSDWNIYSTEEEEIFICKVFCICCRGVYLSFL